MQKRLALVLLALPASLYAQEEQPPTVQQQRDTVTVNVAADPLLRGFRWRSIGPVGQGGRVDDIAVDEKNPSVAAEAKVRLGELTAKVAKAG